MKCLYLIFLLCIFNFFYVSDTQLYTRIPKYEVKYVVWDFLSNNQINNCFQYELYDLRFINEKHNQSKFRIIEDIFPSRIDLNK